MLSHKVIFGVRVTYQFLNEGFWRKDSPTKAHDALALRGRVKTDVVVIGGGFSGLSASLELARRGHSVILIERTGVGHGASSYNCGHVGIQLGKNPHLTLKKIGEEKTKLYADLLKLAIANVRKVVDASGVECFYREKGNLTAGVSEPQRKDVENTFLACEKVGLPVKMLSRSDLDMMQVPAFVDSAFHELIGGDIQPARYVQALRQLAEKAGVKIYQNTPATNIVCADPVQVETPDGQIVADMAVLAMNAYSGEIGIMRRSIMPWSVSVMVTERLDDAQWERIGWKSREPIHTPHRMIENIRTTHDGRILIGTKRARLGWGTNHPIANHPDTFALLTRVLRERFPQIPDLNPAYTWTGRVAIASDGLPIFDYYKGRENIVFAGGYGGHGIPMASYSGRIIADMLTGQDTSYASIFVNRKMRPLLPPEPLRWLIGQALKHSMAHADERIDRAARRRNAQKPSAFASLNSEES